VGNPRVAKKKSPAFSAGPAQSNSASKLPLVLAVLAGLVALTHRVLLLLSGFLATALLLTGALVGA
jgi:hypothetical protein